MTYDVVRNFFKYLKNYKAIETNKIFKFLFAFIMNLFYKLKLRAFLYIT